MEIIRMIILKYCLSCCSNVFLHSCSSLENLASLACRSLESGASLSWRIASLTCRSLETAASLSRRSLETSASLPSLTGKYCFPVLDPILPILTIKLKLFLPILEVPILLVLVPLLVLDVSLPLLQTLKKFPFRRHHSPESPHVCQKKISWVRKLQSSERS